MVSPKRKWRSSERIALDLLEGLGYRVLETRKKIKVEGVEIGEVDAIAMDGDGNKYAVEIKAGRVDVSGLRQAYVNAMLLGMKPLVIAKGFADDAAAVLAEKLGIKVYQLSDYFLVEAEELESLIRESINSIIAETINTIVSSKPISPEDLDFIEKIVSSQTITELASKLGLSVNDVAKRIRVLQNKGVIPRSAKTYTLIRYYASLALLRQRINEIVFMIRSLLKQINMSEAHRGLSR